MYQLDKLTKVMTKRKTLGQYIRERRDELDLSLRELAKKVNCSAPFLSDVELGRRNPSDKMFSKIAEALDITDEKLSEYDSRPPVEEVKKATQLDPEYAFAFRKIIDQEVSPEELLELAEKVKSSKKTKTKE